MTEQEQSETLRWRDLPAELVEAWGVMMVDEWNSRTRLGKALYPIWLSTSALEWAMALIVIAFVAVGSAVIRAFEKPSTKTAPIYKEEK